MSPRNSAVSGGRVYTEAFLAFAYHRLSLLNFGKARGSVVFEWARITHWGLLYYAIDGQGQGN